MQTADSILINEIRKRNTKVYEALFLDLYPQLVRFAEGYLFDRQVSEDLVQNLFIYFWENSAEIPVGISLKSYFFQSIKNRCLNHLRDLKIHDKHNLLYLEGILNQPHLEEIEDPGILSHIQEAMDQLPEKMAIIFRQKYVEGRKIREIAELNQVSENTVKTQLQRARERLRSLLLEKSALNFLL